MYWIILTLALMSRNYLIIDINIFLRRNMWGHRWTTAVIGSTWIEFLAHDDHQCIATFLIDSFFQMEMKQSSTNSSQHEETSETLLETPLSSFTIKKFNTWLQNRDGLPGNLLIVGTSPAHSRIDDLLRLSIWTRTATRLHEENIF